MIDSIDLMAILLTASLLHGVLECEELIVNSSNSS